MAELCGRRAFGDRHGDSDTGDIDNPCDIARAGRDFGRREFGDGDGGDGVGDCASAGGFGFGKSNNQRVAHGRDGDAGGAFLRRRRKQREHYGDGAGRIAGRPGDKQQHRGEHINGGRVAGDGCGF